jgi:hypothetical protein
MPLPIADFRLPIELKEASGFLDTHFLECAARTMDDDNWRSSIDNRKSTIGN